MSYSQQYEMKTAPLSTVHEHSSHPPPPELPSSGPPSPCPSVRSSRKKESLSASRCREVGKLFPIPVMPKLEKLAEPQPMKRTVPGYDMRTLRKQVEAMHSEIAIRVDLQQKLFQQNDIMFSYVHELLKAQRKNERTMKTHVLSLQEELFSLQEEKSVLVDKITAAYTTKDAIKSLEAQQNRLEQQILDIQNERRASVIAGQEHTAENQEIENRLKESITQMQALHVQLEDLRHIKAEEEAEERAERFFRYNQTILRGAFSRFRRTLSSWKGSRRAYIALRKFRSKELFRVHFDMWVCFLKICRLIKTNRKKKTLEYARVCMAKWKMYTALEKFYHQACQRRLKNKYLNYWKEYMQEKSKEAMADALLEKIEYRRHLRALFQNWKRGIMFLEWNSRELIRQERIATRHLLKRILALWRQDAERSKEDVVSRALLAGRSYVLRFPFRLWRKLLEASHLRRAQLAARGLSYLKQNVKRRRQRHYYQRYVSSEIPDLRLRAYLKRWHRRTIECKHYQHKPVGLLTSLSNTPTSAATYRLVSGNTTSKFKMDLGTSASAVLKSEVDTVTFLSGSTATGPMSTQLVKNKSTKREEEQYLYRMRQMHRRKAFSALLKWARGAARMRTARLKRNLGIRHAVISKARKCFKRWYFNTCIRKRAIMEAEEQLKRMVFDRWCMFVPMEVRQKHLDRQVEQLYARRQINSQTSLLRRWHRRARKRYRLKYIYVQVQEKGRAWLTRRSYGYWKGQWARQLLWHERECKISAKKNFALVELKVKELEDRGREKEALDKELEETKAALARVEEALELRSKEVLDREEVIKVTAEQVLNLEESLKQSQTALSDIKEERKRLRLIEEVYEHDQEVIKQQQKAMQIEATEVLQSLEASTEELRREASQARSFVVHAKEQAQRSLSVEENALQETLLASTDLQQRVTQKVKEVEEVESERESVLNAISRVKENLQNVTQEIYAFESKGSNSGDSSTSSSSSYFDELQRDIRHKESEIQALRMKTGQTEARVSSLREAIATRKEQISRAKRADDERHNFRDTQTMRSLYEVHSTYQSPLSIPSDNNNMRSSSPYKRYTSPTSFSPVEHSSYENYIENVRTKDDYSGQSPAFRLSELGRSANAYESQEKIDRRSHSPYFTKSQRDSQSIYSQKDSNMDTLYAPDVKHERSRDYAESKLHPESLSEHLT